MATIRRRGNKYQVQVRKDGYKTVSATIQVYQLPEVRQKRLKSVTILWRQIGASIFRTFNEFVIQRKTRSSEILTQIQKL
jgi:hypothetical protein